MKKMMPFIAVTCAVVSASLWLGCQDRKSSMSSVGDLSATTNAAGREYKTVDKAMSEADLRQNMQEWQREGWAVLSISAAVEHPDGTVHRKVELRRAKQQ